MFEKALPYYMAIGMSPDEFWHGDSSLTAAYRDAYKLKQKNLNWQLWMQGLYIYDAVAVAVGNNLSKKGAKRLEYLKEPLEIFEKTEAEKKVEEEKARQKVIAQLNQWKARWDRAQKKKKE